MEKFKIEVNHFQTHIYADDVEIDNVTDVEFHADVESLPEVRLTLHPRNLEIVGDGSARYYADDPTARRFVNGQYGWREDESTTADEVSDQCTTDDGEEKA